MTPRIARVALNVPLSRLFDYVLPDGMREPEIGARLRVPFGRRKLVGVVFELPGKTDVAPDKLKSALDILDDDPLLKASDLWLLQFCSNYYHHPLGEVVAAALPTLLRQGKPLVRNVDFVMTTDKEPDLLARAPKQRALYDLVHASGPSGILDTDLNDALPAWRPAFKALEDKGVLKKRRGPEPSHRADGRKGTPGPTLNAAQDKAVSAISEHVGFGCFLLDGVTGSGKTEVYLSLIQRVLDAGQQALVLVPEIGLTPQLVNRFRTRLGIEPAVMHSALTDIERLDAWRCARTGEAQLIVGTRSSIFVPLPNAGIIIVDEEHDASLKQQEGFRYSARDLAVARAKHASVPAILGSATPTLESLAQCTAGQYQLLSLPERAGGAKPPRIRILDLLRFPARDGLSTQLIESTREHLEAGGQALLFLNRRGFAPTLICSDCAHVAECRRCDARMTVHAGNNRLQCHHCGSVRAIDSACGECGADMRPLGEGTERLEQALLEHFPDQRIKRIDSDTVQRKGAIGEALELATAGGADILVGTQMLSKGHHFPKLTLVGIINADQGLFGTDFRSGERLAQSIVQVAGRAGREQQAGEVLIQTAFADHPFWQKLMTGGYPDIAASELGERKAMHWPPYSRLALLRASAHSADDAMQFLREAKQQASHLTQDAVRILGPVHAPMARRAGRYRSQLLLQSADRRPLHALLAQLRPVLEASNSSRKVRWSIDVDPIELL